MASKTGRMAPWHTEGNMTGQGMGSARRLEMGAGTHSGISEDGLDIVPEHHLVEDLSSRLADKAEMGQESRVKEISGLSRWPRIL